MKAEFHGFSSRRDVMRAAKGGQEVVERHLVRDVDDRKAQAPLIPVAVEKVVFAEGDVEEVARLYARRILIVIFRSRRRDLEQRRAELRERGRTEGKGTVGVACWPRCRSSGFGTPDRLSSE